MGEMASDVLDHTRRETWRVVVRAILSFAVGAVLLVWLWAGWAVAYLSGDDWKYTAQFALAILGSSLAVWTLVLGFRRRERAYHVLVALSVGCAVIWTGWFMTGEF